MPAAPEHLVTVLAAQVVSHGPQGLTPSPARCQDRLRSLLERQGAPLLAPPGEEEGVLARFGCASEAVAAVLPLLRETLADSGLHLRLAVHTGAAAAPAAQRCWQLLNVAAGGQLLLSAAAAEQACTALPAGAALRPLGVCRLLDLFATEQVYALVHPALPAALLPPRDLGAYPHNLPLQLTSFVGRERELAAVQGRLHSSRLVTLTGAAGTGKTRLALQAAASLLPRFTDGAWLAELAPLADPALLARTVLSSLGQPEQAGQSAEQTLVAYLQPRRLLLVLDNCEHLIDPSAGLVQTLLTACPHLHILATSRSALLVSGESTWTVPPLGLPEGRRPPAPEALAQSEAVCLFVERATSISVGFRLTAANAEAVVQICRRLDGIPLAVELAAARVAVLAPAQIAERLDECLPLLTRGSRTAPERLQTLRGAIAWSHRLLSEGEQVLWRRLAVFAGGFTLAAATAVAAGPGLREDQVLPLLSHLLDKSLALAGDEGSVRRFRLLEPLRQYALEQLRAAGEEPEVRGRQREWCIALAAEAAAAQWGPEQPAWHDRLEREMDNLRAALDWSRSAGGAAGGIRLASGLPWFWDNRGYLQEGRAYLSAFLDQGEPLRAPERAEALTLLAQLATQQGDFAGAAAPAAEALALWRQLQRPVDVARVLTCLGMAHHHHGAVAEALAALGEAVDLLRRNSEGAAILHLALYFLAEAVTSAGDSQRAVTVHQKGLALGRSLGSIMVPFALLRLARLASLRGDHAQALALQRECLPLLDPSFQRGIAMGLSDLAITLAVSGGARELARAVRLFAASEALWQALGLASIGFRVDDRQQGLAAARAHLGEEAVAAAWAQGQALTVEQAVNHALAEVPALDLPAPARRAPELTGELARFTMRELEIVRLLVQGLSPVEIGARLHLSARTVEKHEQNARSKLALPNRVSLLLWGSERGLGRKNAGQDAGR